MRWWSAARWAPPPVRRWATRSIIPVDARRLLRRRFVAGIDIRLAAAEEIDDVLQVQIRQRGLGKARMERIAEDEHGHDQQHAENADGLILVHHDAVPCPSRSARELTWR